MSSDGQDHVIKMVYPPMDNEYEHDNNIARSISQWPMLKSPCRDNDVGDNVMATNISIIVVVNS